MNLLYTLKPKTEVGRRIRCETETAFGVPAEPGRMKPKARHVLDSISITVAVTSLRPKHNHTHNHTVCSTLFAIYPIHCTYTRFSLERGEAVSLRRLVGLGGIWLRPIS